MRIIKSISLLIGFCAVLAHAYPVWAQNTPTLLNCGAIIQAETTTADPNPAHSWRHHDYAIDLHAADVITVVMTPIGPSAAVNIHLYDPSNTIIANTDWSVNGKPIAINSFVISASGRDLLRAWTSTVSAYTLTVECLLADGTLIKPGSASTGGNNGAKSDGSNPSSSAPTFSGNGFPGLAPVDFANVAKIPYTLGTPISGAVVKGAPPLGYTFDGAANQTVDLTYVRLSGNTNVAVVVLSADNKVIFQTSLVTSNSLTTQFVLPTDGQYTIGVFPIDLLTPDPAQPTAFTITASFSGQTGGGSPPVTAAIVPTESVPASAIAANINGVWAGELVQTGGSKFSLEFTIDQADTKVSGTARISLTNDAKTFGVIEFSGEWKDGVFTFKESAVKDQNPPKGQWNWCLKSGTLKVSDDGASLSGTWNAPGCGAGTITVSKKA